MNPHTRNFVTLMTIATLGATSLFLAPLAAAEPPGAWICQGNFYEDHVLKTFVCDGTSIHWGNVVCVGVWEYANAVCHPRWIRILGDDVFLVGECSWVGTLVKCGGYSAGTPVEAVSLSRVGLPAPGYCVIGESRTFCGGYLNGGAHAFDVPVGVPVLL